MKNKEIFKEEICELACEGKEIAVNKSTNTPCDCNEILCTKCALQKSCLWTSHTAAVREWCNEEYKEPCEFEKDELVEVSDDGRTWCLRYFSHIDEKARGGKYRIWNFGLTSKEALTTSGWDYCRKYGTLGDLVKGEEQCRIV